MGLAAEPFGASLADTTPDDGQGVYPLRVPCRILQTQGEAVINILKPLAGKQFGFVLGLDRIGGKNILFLEVHLIWRVLVLYI